MRAPKRIVALGVGGALVVAGCGRGGDDGEKVATVSRIDLLSAAEDAGSARIAMSYDLPLGEPGGDGLGFGVPLRLVAELEGVSDFDGDRSNLSGTYEMTSALPEGAVDEVVDPPPVQIEVRAVGDDSWGRSWPAGEEPGPWSEQNTADEKFEEVGEAIDADGSPVGDGEEADDGSLSDMVGGAPEDEPVAEEDDSLADLLDPTDLDPSPLLDELRDRADSFTEEGADTVRDADTTRYRAALALDPDEEDEIGQYWSDPAEVGVVRVWLDADERLRRIQLGALTIELWDFGVAVDVAAPTDVSGEADFGDEFFGTPEVVGDWSLEGQGTTSGTAWEVHGAEGEQLGVTIPCRTLEPVGSAGQVEDELFGGALSYPSHDGTVATCGSSPFGLFLGALGVVGDPALQVLGSPFAFSSDADEELPTLVGLVVSPRFREGPVRLVRDGAEPVELPLDGAGIAVWDSAGSPRVTSVELAGGSVRCPTLDPYTGLASEEGATAPDEEGWDQVGSGLELGVGACVRT